MTLEPETQKGFVPDIRLLALMAGVGPVVILGLLAVLTWEAADAVFVFAALGDLRWSPSSESFGVIPLIIGSLMTAAVSTGISVCVAVPAAIYIALMASHAEGRALDLVVSVSAAMPSVVIGVVGIGLLSPVTGFNVLTASIALSAMIAPTLTMLSVAILRQVPEGLLQNATALGISRNQAVFRIVLAAAVRPLCGAVLLSLGRALGEATAVSAVVGNFAGSTVPGLFEAAQTLTSTLLIEHPGATDAHLAVLHLLALIVAALVACIGFAGNTIMRSGRAAS